MSKKFFTRITLVLILFLSLAAFNVQGQAVVTTDQPDYLPGTTVTISGSGFQPGENVKLQVLHNPTGGDDSTSAAHQPWTVIADSSGNIYATWDVPPNQDESGANLILTSDGESSLLHSEVLFTDAAFSSVANGNWDSRNTWGAVARTGQINAATNSTSITGAGTAFLTELVVGDIIYRSDGTTVIGTVASISSNTSLTLTANATNNDGNNAGSAVFSAKKIPGAGDAVTIASGNTVTVATNASCTSLSFLQTSTVNSQLSINSGITLAVSGAVTIPRQGTNNNTLAVGAGILNAGSIAFTNAGNTARHFLTISTGTVNVTGNIDASGSNGSATIQMTGAGTINVGGTFLGGGTGTFTPSTGTVNFNGSTSAQTIPVSTYNFNNVQINNTNVNGATLDGPSTATDILGNISVQSGMLDNGGFAITLASGKNFSVSNGANFTLNGTTSMVTVSGGGTKTFGATSTVEYGGAAQTVTVEGYGNLALSGSGTKTFSGATTIAGNLSISPTAVARLLAGSTSTAATLTLAGSGANSGSWGSTSSAATNKNNTYFGPTTGILNVTTNTCTTPTITTTGSLTGCTGTTTTSLTYSATANSPTSYSIDWDDAANGDGLGDQGTTNFAFAAGGGTINNIAITGGTPDGIYHGIMTITSAGGCSSTKAITLVLNATPTSVNGTQTICSPAALNFDLSSLITNSITSTYQWSAVNNGNVGGEGSGTSSFINNTLTLGFGVTQTTVVYNVTPTSTTGACAGSPFTVSVTVNSTPAQPGTITGPTPVCPNIGNITYSVASVTGATDYTWSVPTGWLITAGQGTNSISVTSGGLLQNGNISVTASNTCGTSSARTLAVTIFDANNIGFNNVVTNNTLTVCAGTSGTIVGGNPVNPETYQWQVSTTSTAGPFSIVSPNPGDVQNWTISSNYFNNPGTYYFRRVISGNDNCNGESDVVTFVVNPLPVVAALTGSQTICIGATTTFASVTDGGVWSSDNNARATVVNGVVTGVSAGTANISYAVTNEFGCTTTVSRSVTIIAPPAATPTISGSISVCSVDNSLSYSISTVSNATYVWTVPTGWIITSGQNTNSINVTSGTTGQSGNITVAVSNACGAGLGTLAVGFLDDIGYNGVPTANSATTCRGTAPSNPIIGGAAPQGPFYQWQVSSNGAGFVNIFGATAQNYTISSTYYNVAGTHIFHRVISSSTNACNGTSDDVTLTVNTPPSITTSPSSVTLTYGSSASFSSVVAPGAGAVTYQWQENAGSGFVNINDGGIYSNATTATLSISEPNVAMSGYKYQVIVTGGCSPAATSASATLTVNKRAVTVTADAGQTKVYGDVDPLSFGYHISSGTLAFVTDGFSGALSRVAGEPAGLYAITLDNLTLGNNYNLGFVPANFGITQLPVTITADAQNKTYGDVDPALTFTSNPAVGDALANGLSIAFTGSLTRAAGEAVGSYAINQGSVNNANYIISYNGANLKIDPLAVTVTAAAKNKTYGDVDPALTFTSSPSVGSALANGISIAFTGSLTRVAGETVGSYAIKQGSVDNANYDITYNGANLIIDPLAVTVTAAAKNKTYGDVDPALTFTSSPAVGSALANGISIAFTGSLTRAAGETVGSYAINQGSVDNANYDITYNGANLIIDPLAVTVTADAQNKTYGNVDPALTFTSSPAVGSSLANGISIAFTGFLTRTPGEPVGSYAINQGTVDNANYDITYNGANLKINPLAVTVTADAKGKIYGDVDPALTFTSSPAVGSALATGDLISFSGELSRDPGETVGSYAIKQGTVDNANYDISYNGANLKIDPLAVTVTPNANSKIYGDVDPALTGTLTGFLPADNVTASYSRAAGETVAGGPYTISATLSPANVLGNYDITYNTANFTIGKATSSTVVTIAAGPFTYTSSAITPASVSVTGAGGLNLTPAANYADNTNAGTATASYTFAGDANHFGSDDSKSFTIDKATLSVVANSKAKFSGQVNPSLDGTLAGVLGTDGITATYSTVATQASCAGSYPIVPALVDPNGKLGNYAVTATNGTLVVTGNTVDLFDLSPVPFNTSITLYALVKPAAAGIPVDFYIDANPIKVGTGITDALGKASYTISAGKPEDVYGVVASIGSCISSTSGFLPVYDPTKGFACGNGSILSPIGAYPANALNIAKGRFGFSVKYKKGSTLPQGELDFQLKKNKFKLESTSFQWLVIAGNKAQFSGTGKINGTGTYNFTVTAIDNSPCEIDDEHDGDCDDDRDHHEGFDLDENHAGYHRDGKKCNDRKCLTPDQFRIKITTTAGVVIYDNQMGMPIDGYAASDITRGAIEVNDLKATKRSTGANVIAATPAVTNLSLAVTSLEVNVMPNPTTNYFNVVIKGKDASPVTVRVMNIYGKVILNQKVASTATLHMGDNWTNGTYLIEVIQGNEKKVMRAIKAN